ncbi:hypothetical protein ACTJLC_05305 [Paraburkholderia sp. 22099]|jgi:hypothetical protein|uniref:DNA-directed RNA polymerase II n=1 Tax=Paraburkholderia terricola TaxID=169427 RepID=A0ABU1LJ14_9BURK|nr:hypothetical protein [Paraburkholderia terricola]MDR6406718.1 hypothetical protein [Paraburkholderia terricola]MDR6446550.1 hypothetical protein [Paraburkholderia terricola]MDR6479603.1 hypothetical protein [Paraburkholderia terricola]MDR6490128.1 hypothetical protein [Paraburkholderia terricola]
MAFVFDAVESEARAIEYPPVAEAAFPSATSLTIVVLPAMPAIAFVPPAKEFTPFELAPKPAAMEPLPEAVAVSPNAAESSPTAFANLPTAVLFNPLPYALAPTAVA